MVKTKEMGKAVAEEAMVSFDIFMYEYMKYCQLIEKSFELLLVLEVFC